MRRFLLFSILLLAATAAIVIANISRDPSAYGIDWRLKRPMRKQMVEFGSPTRGAVVQTITAPGVIELVEQANIASQTVGKVIEVLVKKGQLVKKDQLLVRLDSTDAQARMESADARIERLRAAIKLAEADLEKAFRDAEGFEKLLDRGFSTPTELADARTTVSKMQATVSMSKFDLNEMVAARQNSQEDLNRTQITAPIDGAVVDLDVEVGEIVIAGTTNLPGTVLMVIGDVKRKRVRAEVDESDVVQVDEEQRARIFLQSDQKNPLTGSVELVAPTGVKLGEVVTFETLVRIDGEQPNLRPGMTATLEIEVKQTENALRVPVQAVVQRRLKELPKTKIFQDWADRQEAAPGETTQDIQLRYVPVVFLKDGKKAKAVPVEIGISDEEQIEILSGMDEDDELVVGPFRALDELKDGTPIEKQKKDADGKDRSG